MNPRWVFTNAISAMDTLLVLSAPTCERRSTDVPENRIWRAATAVSHSEAEPWNETMSVSGVVGLHGCAA